MFVNKLLMICLLFIAASTQAQTAPSHTVVPQSEINSDVKNNSVLSPISPESLTKLPSTKTIDDIIQSAQQKNSFRTAPDIGGANNLQTTMGKEVLPYKQPELGLPLPSKPQEMNSETSLVGLYLSQQNTIAEFNIGGQARFMTIGGRLQGGWIIQKINSQAVDLGRCIARKSCETKIIYYEAN